jgi:pimeloyl-ACP methyl ester carboxylesterase
VVALILFLLVFYGLYPFYQVYQYVRPLRLRVRLDGPVNAGLNFHEVRFVSQDGLKLSGWYLPSRNGAAVILVHGYGGNRLAMISQAKALARGGYGALLFDLRAHGESDGRLFAMGWDATADVLGALDYLRRRMDVRPGRIGALGVSMGGQVVLRAAALTEELRAVVADGPGPATSRDVWPPLSLLGWVYLPLRPIYDKAVTWYTGVPVPASVTEVISRIAPRPLLLISTGRRGEQRLVRRFYEAAGEPKHLWEIPEAYHAGGWRARPEEYAAKIVGFFDEALLPTS